MATKNKKKVTKIAHGTGVGNLVKGMIREGKTNEQALAAVEKKFPESRLNLGSVGWYRNSLRKAGEKIKTNGELKAAPAKKRPVVKAKTKRAKPAPEVAADLV